MTKQEKGFPSYCENQGYRNNRCAGYALAAVLSDTENPGEHSGLQTYEALLERQKWLSTDSVCGRFLNEPYNIFDGTRMVLPSSVVSYCLSLKLEVRVICSEKRETIFGKEVFEEDCSHISACVHNLQGNESFEKAAAGFQYLLALTRYKHWVALKDTTKGYYLFDPAPPEFGGGTFGPAEFSELLPIEKTAAADTLPVKYFYDLLIGINRHSI